MKQKSPAAKETPVAWRSARDWAWIAGICLLTLLIYWPALHGQFLWDDPAHVTRPALRDWVGLWRIWFEPGSTQQYYPVLHTAFWIEQRLWGDAVPFYHLANVLLHAANCCILALVLRRLWSPGAKSAHRASRPFSIPVGTEWFAALLFAVHPVCVESVAWISEQKNTLSTAFYLLSALAYLRFVPIRKPSVYAIACGLYLLALGTKTTTATLPAALLVVLWWMHGRLDWRRDVLPLLPWAVVAVAAGLVTAWVERTTIGADISVPDLSWIERLLLSSRILWFYCGKVVWPLDLTFFYPLWNVEADAREWVGYLLAGLAVTIGLWLYQKRSRVPLTIWLLYAGTLFPALGFFKVFPFSFSYVADHFQYLAIPVAMTALAAGSARLFQRLPTLLQKTAPFLGGVLVLLLAIKSNFHSRLYRSDEVLFRANITDNPSSWMGHHILALRVGKSPERRDEAIALFQKALELKSNNPDSRAALAALLVREPGHSEEAIALFQEAIRLRPGYAEAHNALANELSARPERLSEAIEHYETALRLRPDFALAEANLAQALARVPERRKEALEHFERALRVLPKYPTAHYHFASLLAGLPDRQHEAILHYEKVLSLRPGSPEAHMGLGKVLLQIGRPSEGIAQFEAALQARGNSPEIHAEFADALARLPGRLPDALAHYEEALRLNPQLAWIHHSVATHLIRIPERSAEAERHIDEALRLNPEYVEAHYLRGVLFAQQGRLEEARTAWNRALEIDASFEPARRNLELLERNRAR